jgi:hypothetical protein
MYPEEACFWLLDNRFAMAGLSMGSGFGML